MKILAIHNRYQLRAGEDECHDAKVRLLVSRGHEVREVLFDNQSIVASKAALALKTSWNRGAYRLVIETIKGWQPDVIDIDNFFPLASPAIYYAARKMAIPTVQTLHNFRLICPGSVLFRDGHVCEECVHKTVPWPALIHKCYRDDLGATAATATMLGLHRMMGTWTKYVTIFIALTEFARAKFIEGGLPAERIVVKPNFVEMDEGPGSGDGNYVLYVGRLIAEKGIDFLLNAWPRVGQGKLIIVGNGPLALQVQRAAESSSDIQYQGRKTLAEVHELMSRARGLVFPSQWYEGLPGVILESLSHGTPIIANRLGSMSEIIRNGKTGWLIPPNDPSSFAGAIRECLSGASGYDAMRAACRREFEAYYGADANYEQLMCVYKRAISLNVNDCGLKVSKGNLVSTQESAVNR